MNNTTERVFVVHNIPDYNTIIALVREMNGCIVRVMTSSNNIDDSETIKIVAQGEENHLEFAQYLYNKYKTKIEEMKRNLPLDV